MMNLGFVTFGILSATTDLFFVSTNEFLTGTIFSHRLSKKKVHEDKNTQSKSLLQRAFFQNTFQIISFACLGNN